MNSTSFPVAPTLAHARTPRRRPPLDSWGADVRRILCVRLDHLGDVLMTTPALRALREAAPGRRLTLLASPAGAAIAAHLPDLDDVIEYDPPWCSDAPAGDAREHASFIARLRKERFDAAAIFTVYSQNPLPAATLCFQAGIPLRLAHCRENPYALLTHWVPEREPHVDVRHEVERQLALVAKVGAPGDDNRMRIAVNDADRVAVDARLRESGVAHGAPLVILHPGASAASRRYPPEYYGEALDLLARTTRCTVLLTGSPGETVLTQAIALAVRSETRTRLVDLSGQLTLGELIALIDKAAVLIANNSGPVHIAAALGIPVVDLYALTNPQHTPWMTPHRLLYRDVPCRWCYRSECPEGHHACLRGVPPADVARAAHELLSAGRADQAA